MPDLSITCETCVNFRPNLDGRGECAQLLIRVQHGHGCTRHPNFDKLVEENVRLRELLEGSLSIQNAAFNAGWCAGRDDTERGFEDDTSVTQEQWQEVVDRLTSQIRGALYGEEVKSEPANAH